MQTNNKYWVPSFFGLEVPALRAGTIVCVILAASLINFGAFVVLLCARAGYVYMHRKSGLAALARSFLPDMSLLLVGLIFVFLLQDYPGIHTPVIITLCRGLGTLFIKIMLLRRTIAAYIEVQKPLSKKKRPVSLGERVACIVLIAAFILILCIPYWMSGMSLQLLQFVKRELLPWHV